MCIEIVPFTNGAAGRERRRRITAAVAAGLFIVLWSVCVYAEVSFREISDHVLRLHVLANSDSPEDQALKLKVRDRVLAETELLLADCDTRQAAESCVIDHIDQLSAAAVSCVAEEGYAYPVAVRMENIYFPTRSYEGGSLPAGVYKALRVEIGEAQGQNWWCVLFPQLCFVNATVPEATPAPATATPKPALKPTPTPQPTEPPVSVDTDSVTLRFKFIDLFQKTKNEIKSIWTWITG